MKIQFSCDDGHETDLQVAKQFKERGLGCIFYVPTNMVQTNKDEYRIVHPRGGHHLYLHELKELAKDFEIGGHTVTHPMMMRNLSREHQWLEISDGRKQLQEWTGQDIKSFCYPRGRYDKTTIELVRKAGFTNARTVDIGVGMKNDNPFELLAYHCANRREYDGRDWYDVITEVIDLHKETDETICIWFHCWELSNDKAFDKLEKLLDFVAKL